MAFHMPGEKYVLSNTAVQMYQCWQLGMSLLDDVILTLFHLKHVPQSVQSHAVVWKGLLLEDLPHSRLFQLLHVRLDVLKVLDVRTDVSCLHHDCDEAACNSQVRYLVFTTT